MPPVREARTGSRIIWSEALTLINRSPPSRSAGSASSPRNAGSVADAASSGWAVAASARGPSPMVTVRSPGPSGICVGERLLRVGDSRDGFAERVQGFLEQWCGRRRRRRSGRSAAAGWARRPRPGACRRRAPDVRCLGRPTTMAMRLFAGPAQRETGTPPPLPPGRLRRPCRAACAAGSTLASADRGRGDRRSCRLSPGSGAPSSDPARAVIPAPSPR